MEFGSFIDFTITGDEKAPNLVNYAYNVLCFDSASPLHRCMASEFDFTLMPYPIVEQSSCHVRGVVSSDLYQLLMYHPDTKRVKGVLKASIPSSKFLLFLENAFITYLSFGKTKKLSLPRGL